MAKATKQLIYPDHREKYAALDQAEIKERYLALSRANKAIQDVVNEDYSSGYIDEESAHILRELSYQVLKTIYEHNDVWHVEDMGSEYPDNKSVDNEWTIWHIDITAPIHRFLPMENDHDLTF